MSKNLAADLGPLLPSSVDEMTVDVMSIDEKSGQPDRVREEHMKLFFLSPTLAINTIIVSFNEDMRQTLSKLMSCSNNCYSFFANYYYFATN